MTKIDALQRRLNEVESRQRVAKPPAYPRYRTATTPVATAAQTSATVQPPAAAAVQQTPPPTPGLLPPEPMGSQFEDALRSDLPGLSIRIPGVASEARVYGFAKNALPAYGATVAYRRFWPPELRSNIAYSYARQEYPADALEFTSGSAKAIYAMYLKCEGFRRSWRARKDSNL